MLGAQRCRGRESVLLELTKATITHEGPLDGVPVRFVSGE